MTPIEKNIHVVDERGNVYEATWPKRARGLVKHGIEIYWPNFISQYKSIKLAETGWYQRV